jgi:two-component system, OmpR family, response regulator
MSTPVMQSAMKPTALVVVANSAEYEQIMYCLQPFYLSVQATSIDEATRQLQHLQPVVVVLDPDLPDGDGMEWLRYLRSNPATRELIVSCVSHRSTVRDKVTGFIAGADDYVIYPLNRDTFGYRLALLTRIGRHSAWKR